MQLFELNGNKIGLFGDNTKWCLQTLANQTSARSSRERTPSPSFDSPPKSIERNLQSSLDKEANNNGISPTNSNNIPQLLPSSSSITSSSMNLVNIDLQLLQQQIERH